MAKPLNLIYFDDYWETALYYRKQQLALRLIERVKVEKLSIKNSQSLCSIGTKRAYELMMGALGLVVGNVLK